MIKNDVLLNEEIDPKLVSLLIYFLWRKIEAHWIERNLGSISVSGQLPTYPSPNSTLTLTCCQLTVVELGEG